MKLNAIQNRTAIADIKRRYVLGEIDRTQAKQEARPVLEQINADITKVTEKLNKKYGLNRKPPLLTFITAMRDEY